MNNNFINIIYYLKKNNMYNIVILIISIFIVSCFIKLFLKKTNNKKDETNNETETDETNNEPQPLYLPPLDNEIDNETINETNNEINNESDTFYDNINIRTNNNLYTKKDKHNDVLLDLYNDMYEDISYYNLSDLKEENLIKKEKTLFGGDAHDDSNIEEMIKSVRKINNQEDEDNIDDFANNNNQKIIYSEDDSYSYQDSNQKITASIASSLDNKNNLILKRFKINNIISINNKIGIIKNIDKKNILIFYKIINNSNINDLSETFTLDESQFDNINIISDTFNEYKKYLNNNKLINNSTTNLNNKWISFLNDKKWFPINFNTKFTINNTLLDIYEYIFNNINIYTNLSTTEINNLNTKFTNEYTNSIVDINNININKDNLNNNMSSNIRKNIKLKMLNSISINHFKDLKLISLIQSNDYNYEKYLIDYYNIYVIISNYKLNNIKLNKNICRDLLESYKTQCNSTSLIHFDDCQKEQLHRARIQREKLNNQIELLETNNT